MVVVGVMGVVVVDPRLGPPSSVLRPRSSVRIPDSRFPDSRFFLKPLSDASSTPPLLPSQLSRYRNTYQFSYTISNSGRGHSKKNLSGPGKQKTFSSE